MPVMMIVVLALTATALLLESIEKKTRLIADEKPRAPETESGFWARTCFSWLAATFWIGYSKVISVNDLPDFDPKLESRKLHERLKSTLVKCEFNIYNAIQITHI